MLLLVNRYTELNFLLSASVHLVDEAPSGIIYHEEP